MRLLDTAGFDEAVGVPRLKAGEQTTLAAHSMVVLQRLP